MLKDCLEVFKKEYIDKGEDYITGRYTLNDGSYILVYEDGSYDDAYNVNKKTDKNEEKYKYFSKLDYFSKLIDMNKPVDMKKVIHSNNYLSFFVKKTNVKSDKPGEGKLNKEIIENYYTALLNPVFRFGNDKEKINLFKAVEEEYGKIDEKELLKCKQWIIEKIYTVFDEIPKDKNYLKIFFKADIKKYKAESEKYIVPNIYNSTKYNITVNNQIYGLPNDNMGLNAKKPYLDNKTRKNSLPYLISEEEVLIQKKFFDLLYNFASEGKTNIYINIKDKWIRNEPGYDFTGYYLRLKKGKEVEIHDFDVITDYKQEIKGFDVAMVIPIDYANSNYEKTLSYTEINDIRKLEQCMNILYFNKFLIANYFSEYKDIKLNDPIIKCNLLKSRIAFFNWFYKNDKNPIKSIIDRVTINIIKNSICNSNINKAKEQFNLRCALLQYLKGGEKMADTINNIANILREKANADTTDKFENDKEYYFAAGQLVSYLISLNKANKKMHSLINPVLNCKTDEKLKSEVRKLFIKYNYTIMKENKKFNNLYAMFVGYESDGEILKDYLVAGYLYNNLIYEKNK